MVNTGQHPHNGATSVRHYKPPSVDGITILCFTFKGEPKVNVPSNIGMHAVYLPDYDVSRRDWPR